MAVLGLAISKAAKVVFSSVLVSFVKGTTSKVVDCAASKAADKVKDGFSGGDDARRTVSEWAEIAVKGVDRIKEQAVDEGLGFVGGKLNFTPSEQETDDISVSFELYFQDPDEQWLKIGGDCNLPASAFTYGAVGEIMQKKKISFEVE